MRVGWRGKAVELAEWMTAERPVWAERSAVVKRSAWAERSAMVCGRAWVALVSLAWALVLAWASAGCSSADAVKAAGVVHAYLPVVSGLAQDAMAIAEGLDPANAQLIGQVSVRVQGDLTEMESLSDAYMATPTADTWTRLLAVVDRMVNDADQGLMAALAIKNPQSQMEAKVALSALDAAIHVVDGYLAAARTPMQAKAAAASRTMKVKAVSRAWSEADKDRVAMALGERVDVMVEAASEAGY